MSRHPAFTGALAVLCVAVSACTTGGDGQHAAAATIPSQPSPTAVDRHVDGPAADDATGSDLMAAAWWSDPVVVAIEFVEQSEPVAMSDAVELEARLARFVHPSARDEVIGEIRRSTHDNQELGLSRWRHAVVEASWTDLVDGDVRVELWQVAVLTVEPARGPVQTATVWATDILTLTDTSQGWRIVDRIVRAGPTPPLAASTIGDDAALIEDRLVGFDDAHNLLTHDRVGR
jgi:hypothetical protein